MQDFNDLSDNEKEFITKNNQNLEFIIDFKIKSQNSTYYSVNYRKYFIYKREFYQAFLNYKSTKIINKEQRHYITITSYRKRILDYGNLVGGSKPIPDVLIKNGYIYDDGPKNGKIDYFQRKSLKEFTEIKVWYLP